MIPQARSGHESWTMIDGFISHDVTVMMRFLPCFTSGHSPNVHSLGSMYFASNKTDECFLFLNGGWANGCYYFKTKTCLPPRTIYICCMS